MDKIGDECRSGTHFIMRSHSMGQTNDKYRRKKSKLVYLVRLQYKIVRIFIQYVHYLFTI